MKSPQTLAKQYKLTKELRINSGIAHTIEGAELAIDLTNKRVYDLKTDPPSIHAKMQENLNKSGLEAFLKTFLSVYGKGAEPEEFAEQNEFIEAYFIGDSYEKQQKFNEMAISEDDNLFAAQDRAIAEYFADKPTTTTDNEFSAMNEFISDYYQKK